MSQNTRIASESRRGGAMRPIHVQAVLERDDSPTAVLRAETTSRMRTALFSPARSSDRRAMRRTR
jgi:hypothetical protein